MREWTSYMMMMAFFILILSCLKWRLKRTKCFFMVRLCFYTSSSYINLCSLRRHNRNGTKNGHFHFFVLPSLGQMRLKKLSINFKRFLLLGIASRSNERKRQHMMMIIVRSLFLHVNYIKYFFFSRFSCHTPQRKNPLDKLCVNVKPTGGQAGGQATESFIRSEEMWKICLSAFLNVARNTNIKVFFFRSFWAWHTAS